MKRKYVLFIVLLVFTLLFTAACEKNEATEATDSPSTENQTTATTSVPTKPAETTDTVAATTASAAETTVPVSETAASTAPVSVEQPPNLPEGLQEEIDSVIDEMVETGWTKGTIEVIEGEVDTLERWGISAEPFYFLKNEETLYTVIANSPYDKIPTVSVCIRIIYIPIHQVAVRGDIFYIQQNRLMQSDDLLYAYPWSHSYPEYILSATDEKLIDYFTP